jgi:RHS repeat-associated protein
MQGGAGYDVENRMITSAYSGGTDYYGYDPSNKRIQKTLPDGTNEIHFYGARGERLGIYKLRFDIGSSAVYYSYTSNLYFGGKHLLRFDAGSYTATGSDRLGSESTNLYPWGEEKATSGQNVEKFATYYRDGTGVDYADQRYYSSIMGRFLTVDSGGPDLKHPQTFNRYSYANNDPVNAYDPNGLLAICVSNGFKDAPGINDASNPCVTGAMQHWPFAPVRTVAEYDDMYGTPYERNLQQAVAVVTNSFGDFATNMTVANKSATQFDITFGLMGQPGTQSTYKLVLSDLKALGAYALLLQSLARDQGSTLEDCNRLKTGIGLAQKLKVGGAIVGGVAGLVGVLSKNPVAIGVGAVAGLTGAVGAVSELILNDRYKKLDCDKVIEQAGAQ